MTPQLPTVPEADRVAPGRAVRAILDPADHSAPNAAGAAPLAERAWETALLLTQLSPSPLNPRRRPPAAAGAGPPLGAAGLAGARRAGA